MKVLVTGGTGAFGMAVCERLARAGADPIAMARHEPSTLPTGVRFVAGDIRDPDAVQRAVSGCDAVVHLAWFMGVGRPEEEIRGINEGGTAVLFDAMDRAGCGRLVFTSSVTVYGTSEHHPEPFREDAPLQPIPSFLYADQKGKVEALIAERGFDAVVARATVLLGRSVDNDASQAYAGPALLDIGGRSVVQAIHQDDVARFIEASVLGTARGTVNLAAPGTVSMTRAGELLERRVTRVPLGLALRAADLANRVSTGIDADVVKTLAFWPVVDTTRLTTDWGFTPVWSQEDILRDQARSASRSTHLIPGTKKLPRPRRLPWGATRPPDPTVLRPGVQWTDAAPPDLRGQFDTKVDPAYPLFSATNLSEAFPGPMTPLSLQLAFHGLGAATDCLVQLFGLEGETADLLRIGLSSFGHSVYVNVSSVRLMADLVPGATVEDVDRMYLGIDAPPGPKKKMHPREALGAARLAARIVPRLAGLRAEVDRLVAEADELCSIDPAGLGDDALSSHLSLVHDVICQAWSTSSTGNFLLSGLTSALDDDVHVTGSAGAATLRGVQQLADDVRRSPALAAVLAGEEDAVAALAAVRRADPAFAASFDAVVASCGHRGPGETELANEVFADRPEWLLDVVRRVAARPAPSVERARARGGRPSRTERLARRVLEDKERARDTGVRLIHAFRVATRERARRLVDDGRLADAGDVFYLTYDELFAHTPPGAAVLDARKTERERLARHRMPLTFEGSWAPAVIGDDLAGAGDVLRGVPAVGGTYEGRVRVMTAATDELEPDEVLVTVTTDVGWTPYFALAGAVVTDIGGVASHAAIVAREHGIPSVVGTGDATARLRTGMRVVVDGTAGTVTVRSTD